MRINEGNWVVWSGKLRGNTCAADLPELSSCAVILSGAKNLARIQARSFDKLRMTDWGGNAWVDLMKGLQYKCAGERGAFPQAIRFCREFTSCGISRTRLARLLKFTLYDDKDSSYCDC